MHGGDVEETSELDPWDVLWAEAHEALLETLSVLGGIQLCLAIHPKQANLPQWRIASGQVELSLTEDQKQRAKPAIDSLLQIYEALPLVFDPDQDLDETLVAYLFPPSYLVIQVRSLGAENADVKTMGEAEDARAFIASRQFEASNKTPWDAARQKRIIRKSTVDQKNAVLEPGVVWFIEWLEAQGAQTLFSCEGHPYGFYIVFEGAYELARAIASIDETTVSIFRAESLKEQGQWKLNLANDPEGYDARDEALRVLAGSLTHLKIS